MFQPSVDLLHMVHNNEDNNMNNDITLMLYILVKMGKHINNGQVLNADSVCNESIKHQLLRAMEMRT